MGGWRVFSLVWAFALAAALCAAAQNQVTPTVIQRALIIDGDTIPNVSLGEVRVYAFRKFKSRRQYIKYTRLVHNVKKALPYARIVSKELKMMELRMAVMNEDERADYLQSKEKELFERFEEPIKHLTIKQGRILIKLIDRETGFTTYSIIKDLKGGFKAFWWQGIARLFGSNLKAEYDPEVRDADIENIVLLIDEGKI